MDSDDTLCIEISKKLRPKLQGVHEYYAELPDDERLNVMLCGGERKPGCSADDLLVVRCDSTYIGNCYTGSLTLRQMLNTERSKSLGKKKFKLIFPQIHHRMFPLMLSFMRTGATEVKTVDVEEFIDVAIFLMMDELIAQCFYTLSKTVTPEKSFTFHKIAMKYKDKDLPDQCKLEIENLSIKCSSFMNKSIKETKTARVKKPSIFLISHKENKHIWRLHEDGELEEVDTLLKQGVCSYNYSVCKYNDDSIIITGGVNSKVCLKWIATSKIMTQLGDMMCNRYNHLSVCLENKLLVIGGIVGDDPKSLSVQQMNMRDSKWTERPSLPFFMRDLKLAIIGTNMYILGSRKDPNWAALYCLPLKGKDWRVRTGLMDAGSDFSFTGFKSKLWVAGGSKKICKWYDPFTREWTDVTPPRETHLCASLLFYRDHMLILGGHSNIIETYSLSEKSWKVSDVTLPQELEPHTALVLDISDNAL